MHRPSDTVEISDTARESMRDSELPLVDTGQGDQRQVVWEDDDMSDGEVTVVVLAIIAAVGVIMWMVS